jgi:hypothetical protein
MARYRIGELKSADVSMLVTLFVSQNGLSSNERGSCRLLPVRRRYPRLWVERSWSFPIYRCEPQSSPIHFFAQFVGVLLHALANEPVSTAQLRIQMDLPPDIFIERQKALILGLGEIHFTPRNKNPERFYPASGCRPAPRYVGNRTGTKSPSSELSAMSINSVHVDVVGDAYHIAANYLKKTGRIPDELQIHQPLLDAIVEDYRAGKSNKLILANRAITRMEKAKVLELIS